jgi:hypothetical protein
VSELRSRRREIKPTTTIASPASRCLEVSSCWIEMPWVAARPSAVDVSLARTAAAGGMFERAGIGIRCVYLKMGFQPDLSVTGGSQSPT